MPFFFLEMQVRQMKLQTAGEDSQEIVELEEVESLCLYVERLGSAGASIYYSKLSKAT